MYIRHHIRCSYLNVLVGPGCLRFLCFRFLIVISHYCLNNKEMIFYIDPVGNQSWWRHHYCIITDVQLENRRNDYPAIFCTVQTICNCAVTCIPNKNRGPVGLWWVAGKESPKLRNLVLQRQNPASESSHHLKNKTANAWDRLLVELIWVDLRPRVVRIMIHDDS